MNLKERTKEIHTAAERTKFMQAVFKKNMPVDVWKDYTYNKTLWYGAIETKARAEGYLDDLPDIDRSYKLYQDWREMSGGEWTSKFVPSAIAYHRYILDLPKGMVLAHLYTWHMGDLHGGQMIKKVLDNVPHRNLEFKNVEDLKVKIRAKLSDDLGDEAIKSFEWAIKIMEEFNDRLPENE